MKKQTAAVADGAALLLRAYVGALLFVPRLMYACLFM